MHGVYAVDIDDTILAVTRNSLELGADVRAEANSGQVHPSAVFEVNKEPGGMIETKAVAMALDLLTALGGDNQIAAPIKAGQIVNCYAYQFADGGTREGASSHHKYTINKGLLSLQSLSAEHQGDATLLMNLMILYDGTNAPIVVTPDSSVPTPVEGLTEVFTLAKVVVDDITLSGKLRMSVDFGVTATREGRDSDICARQSTIRTAMPTISISGADPTWFKESGGIPYNGLECAHADTKIYLQKRKDKSSYYPVGESEHIRITVNGLAEIATVFDATHPDVGETGLVITGVKDNGNAPLVISTDVAIA